MVTGLQSLKNMTNFTFFDLDFCDYCNRTLIVQVILENVVTFFSGTQWQCSWNTSENGLVLGSVTSEAKPLCALISWLCRAVVVAAINPEDRPALSCSSLASLLATEARTSDSKASSVSEPDASCLPRCDETRSHSCCNVCWYGNVIQDSKVTYSSNRRQRCVPHTHWTG